MRHFVFSIFVQQISNHEIDAVSKLRMPRAVLQDLGTVSWKLNADHAFRESLKRVLLPDPYLLYCIPSKKRTRYLFRTLIALRK